MRIVVTFAAGGASDIVARAISEPLAKALGQPVIVDNKPGAGGTIGGAEVVRAAPDGYTLMLSNSHAAVDRPVDRAQAAVRPGQAVHPRGDARRGAGADHGQPEERARPR